MLNISLTEVIPKRLLYGTNERVGKHRNNELTKQRGFEQPVPFAIRQGPPSVNMCFCCKKANHPGTETHTIDFCIAITMSGNQASSSSGPAAPVDGHQRCCEYWRAGLFPTGAGAATTYHRCARQAQPPFTCLPLCKGPGDPNQVDAVNANAPGTWPHRHLAGTEHRVCNGYQSCKYWMRRRMAAGETAEINGWKIFLCRRCQDHELRRHNDNPNNIQACTCADYIQARVLCRGCRTGAMEERRQRAAARRTDLRNFRRHELTHDMADVDVDAPENRHGPAYYRRLARESAHDGCRCYRKTDFYRRGNNARFARVVMCRGCDGLRIT